ncbi:hypothetical protein [Sedimenticola thiotaurini]|uniref:hypothetical protein n=1 Tax=Sedimenticola thiotaurini TaxID=1543721 RepID=UPI0019019A9D|nr:hypothetical protein [Sedimenticola thiotaurini]
MGALLKPFVFGSVVGILAVLGLWLAIPLLSSTFGESWFPWYPALVTILPLLLGGYVAARSMRSIYLSRYLIMVALVGSVVMVFIEAATESSGDWDVAIQTFLILAASSIAMAGAYIGSLHNRKA